MTTQFNWCPNTRPNKVQYRQDAVSKTKSGPYNNVILFPGKQCQDLIAGINSGVFDPQSTFLLAVERDALTAKSIEATLKSLNWKNYSLHNGGLVELSLKDFGVKFDYAFFDFCGGLVADLIGWFITNESQFTDNATLCFTFMGSNRGRSRGNLLRDNFLALGTTSKIDNEIILAGGKAFNDIWKTISISSSTPLSTLSATTRAAVAKIYQSMFSVSGTATPLSTQDQRDAQALSRFRTLHWTCHCLGVIFTRDFKFDNISNYKEQHKSNKGVNMNYIRLHFTGNKAAIDSEYYQKFGSVLMRSLHSGKTKLKLSDCIELSKIFS